MCKKQTFRGVEGHLRVIRKTRNALLIKDVISNSSRAKALENLGFAEELNGIAQCVSGCLANERAAVAIANVHESSKSRWLFNILCIKGCALRATDACT